MTELQFIEFNTTGSNDIIDLTQHLTTLLKKTKISQGCVLLFVPGATGALSTIEYEPGLIEDLPEFMEKIIPEKKYYHHNETWHDGNGHSHLRATLIGPSLTIPIHDRELILGTWQQVVFLEFDNKPHRRKIAAQFIG
jgi:secondary thiamine-phosphate synthase enzyme